MAVVFREDWATPFDADGEPYPVFGNRVPALRSFYLGYDIGDATPGDHEITLVQVLAGGASEDLSPDAENAPSRIPDGRIFVAVQDGNAEGEEFFYRVSHSTLSIPALVASRSGTLAVWRSACEKFPGLRESVVMGRATICSRH